MGRSHERVTKTVVKFVILDSRGITAVVLVVLESRTDTAVFTDMRIAGLRK